MPETPPAARFSLVPVIWLAACFSGGIAVGHSVEIDLWSVAVLTAVMAFAAYCLRRSAAATLLIMFAFAAAGAVAHLAERHSLRPDRLKVLYDTGVIVSGEPVEIEGVLAGAPEPSAEGEFLTIRTERLRYRGVDRSVSGNVRLFLPITHVVKPDLKHGSRVVVNCVLEREDEYLNPGVLRRPEMLDQMGIDAAGSVKSPLLVEHISDESVFLPLAWIYDQRSRLIQRFTDELSPSAAGIMTASLLGDKNFLDRDTAQLFREGGTFHVLVISGLHITFIGGILLLIVRQLTSRRWVQFIAATLILWAYTLAVGADVPVVRAAIMFTVVLFSYAIYRQGSMLNSLGLCALILLAWRPSDLFNASFHLTFVSVAGIIALAYPLIDGMRRIGAWTPETHSPFPPDVPEFLRRFCEMLYWRPDVWAVESKRQMWSARIFKAPFMAGRIRGIWQSFLRVAFEGLLVSFVVQICMLPLLVVYFHRVPTVSVILNLWVGFFIALESLATVTGALLAEISEIIAAPLFVIAEVVNWLLLALPRLITGHWWSGLRLPAYSGYGRAVYVLYFAALVVLAYGLHRWDPMRKVTRARPFAVTGAALSVLFLTIIFHPFISPRPDGRLSIDFLDVGQGDAALVKFPDGRTMLVDGGGRMRFKRSDEEEDSFEPDIRRIGESVVSEFLWHRGYSHVDYVLATHADTDHIQGLADVAENFGVIGAFVGRAPPGDPDLQELRQALDRRNVRITVVSSGDMMDFGDVIVEVLYPHYSEAPLITSNNDSSVVIKIVYGDRSFLLTGDIESEAERELTESGPDLLADVIKVPHHGSRTSSTPRLVEAVRPSIAVIPVGRRSPFGHPHPEVVERWRSAGADVRFTGEKGAITISTDGRDLRIETILP